MEVARQGAFGKSRDLPAERSYEYARYSPRGVKVDHSSSIAVLIPCFNEAASIEKVVADFRAMLPQAAIYVYDNNSKDDTVAIAARASAIVRHETQQGKGHVVRRMFADIEADAYVLVDGDDTYDATVAPALIELLIENQLDMINVARAKNVDEAFRPGHKFGNTLLTMLVRLIFGDRIKDMLSGYRIFSRRFVKSFPALSQGFEIETELTVHALELNMAICERVASYKERPTGSVSKLNTVRDGLLILRTIINLVKEERPLAFFGTAGVILILFSIGLGWPIVAEFLKTGLVPRFPTAILATGIVLLGFLSITCGLILDTVTHGRQEARRLHYLATARLSQDIPSLTLTRQGPD